MIHVRESPTGCAAVLVSVGALLITACNDANLSQPEVPARSVMNPLYPEEEFFGDLYSQGAPLASSTYMASLSPFDQTTRSRVYPYPPWSGSMWADPNPQGSHMYGWYDPMGGGLCGGLESYLAGDTTVRGAEHHRPSPGIDPPPGREAHCIRPGLWEFSVAGKTFLIEYLQAMTNEAGSTLYVTNTTAGVAEVVEPLGYETRHTFSDYVVNVDVVPNWSSDVPVLDVENALGAATKDTFTNQPSPSGNETDYFRFSVARSTSAWGSIGEKGTHLARIHWDLGRLNAPTTAYYEGFSDRSFIRIHTFGSHVFESRPVRIALELMRPDEQPNDTVNVALRVVNITRVTAPPPADTACAVAQGLTTWQMTDQYFNGVCSRPGTYEYQWRFYAGGPWTPYSTDTLTDFLGHSPTGPKTVTLRVRNTTTGATAETGLAIEVQSGQIMLDGPTFITDKATQLYTSNATARWFERYNPAWTWYQATATPQQTFTRIWPAGDYTVELRQDTTVNGVLRRGRLHITVCHDECGAFGAPAPAAPTATISADDWGLFGGGPWISWGTAAAPRGVRFYDLWGAHDAPGFSTKSWVDDSAAGEAVPGTAWRLDRVQRDLALMGARAIDFTVTAPTTASYVFGLAFDPDLGADPADDVSGYDRTRGLAFVTDASGAVGLLLRTGGDDALVSLQEYGVGRWAPRLATEIRAAQRTRGVNLVRQPRDVQLVLSADARTGAATFTVVLLRAATLAALQGLADEALARLAASEPPR